MATLNHDVLAQIFALSNEQTWHASTSVCVTWAVVARPFAHRTTVVDLKKTNAGDILAVVPTLSITSFVRTLVLKYGTSSSHPSTMDPNDLRRIMALFPRLLNVKLNEIIWSHPDDFTPDFSQLPQATIRLASVVIHGISTPPPDPQPYTHLAPVLFAFDAIESLTITGHVATYIISPALATHIQSLGIQDLDYRRNYDGFEDPWVDGLEQELFYDGQFLFSNHIFRPLTSRTGLISNISTTLRTVAWFYRPAVGVGAELHQFCRSLPTSVTHFKLTFTEDFYWRARWYLFSWEDFGRGFARFPNLTTLEIQNPENTWDRERWHSTYREVMEGLQQASTHPLSGMLPFL